MPQEAGKRRKELCRVPASPHIDKMTWGVHMGTRMCCQVPQARAIKEISVVYGIHQVPEVSQPSYGIHSYRCTGEADADVDYAL